MVMYMKVVDMVMYREVVVLVFVQGGCGHNGVIEATILQLVCYSVYFIPFSSNFTSIFSLATSISQTWVTNLIRTALFLKILDFNLWTTACYNGWSIVVAN